MRRSLKSGTGTWLRGLLVLPITITVVLVGTLVPAGSALRNDVIVLPGATSAEGIAKGAGTTFYAGDVFQGDIYRGDVRRGTAELFIEAPDARGALGMAVDLRHGLLFVAGAYEIEPGGAVPKPGGFGAAYVYNIRTRKPVATYQLGIPESSMVNGVTVTRQGAYFTDAWLPNIYFVPISRTGRLGPARTIPVTGAAAEILDEFNLNGIAATPDGETLLVSHTAQGLLYTIDPATGASRVVDGIHLHHLDGIALEGSRLWTVQGHDPEEQQVTRIRLNHDLTSGTIEAVMTHEAFQHPTSVVVFGRQLAVVNSKFNTGIPPTADEYEILLMRR